MSQSPILYSFRRCPYAMRARMTLKSCHIHIELREITLRNKPEEMLALSAKGTVPVLHLPNGHVIDESWDIAQWAISQQDPNQLLGKPHQAKQVVSLIQHNDHVFKPQLDLYKYADRFPDYPASFYRTQAEDYLKQLDSLLAKQPFLLGQSLNLIDIGIFPFIRQFAHVDISWFAQTPHTHLQRWLNSLKSSDLFNSVMQKHTPWVAGQPPVIL